VLQELRSCENDGLSREEWSWAAREFRAGNVPPSATEMREPDICGRSPFGGMAKRSLDLLISFLLLPLAVFVGVPIACVIALDGGNPIYGHTRVGWNGRLFRCYKFRTMNVEAEHELDRLLEQDEIARQQWLDRFKLENDPRVTPLGRWLRKTYLDEIPQIWNVLRGDMSWVGPRPVVPAEMEKYGVFQSSYLGCRPGISGLWQINRHSDTTYIQRVGFDVQYAQKWSPARDVTIVLLTIPRILFAGGNVQ